MNCHTICNVNCGLNSFFYIIYYIPNIHFTKNYLGMDLKAC